MTPFAASVPYSVAAEGPLTISMSSISSGLSVLSRENRVSVPDVSASVEIRTPSTTQIGALLKLIDDTPRTRTVGAPPRVDPGSTTTPGALAVSMSAELEISLSSTFLPTSPSVASAFPSSTLRCWPVAVVTTSSSCATAMSSAKSLVVVPPALTFDRSLYRAIADAEHLDLDAPQRNVAQSVFAVLTGIGGDAATDDDDAGIYERRIAFARGDVSGNGRALRGQSAAEGNSVSAAPARAIFQRPKVIVTPFEEVERGNDRDAFRAYEPAPNSAVGAGRCGWTAVRRLLDYMDCGWTATTPTGLCGAIPQLRIAKEAPGPGECNVRTTGAAGSVTCQM